MAITVIFLITEIFNEVTTKVFKKVRHTMSILYPIPAMKSKSTIKSKKPCRLTIMSR